MQSQYYHELDHMRNTSQRLSPSRSLGHPTPNPPTTSFSRTRSHSQSTTTHNHQHVYSSPKAKSSCFDRNDGGWLASSPLQLSASTLHSSPPQKLQHTEPVNNEGCPKDMLRTISNDDILKLTQLTNKLPMVSTRHNHIQNGHGHSTQRQDMVENELLQQLDGPTDSNYSRHIDTDLTHLLNQDFMWSSPISDTEDSTFRTIPSCNPSNISTDTDDSQFSWYNTTISNNKSSKQPPLLRKTLSEQPTTTTTTTKKLGSYHPLTVSTTESDITPSSQNTHYSKPRSWYRHLMRRDRKGKIKHNNSPTTNDDETVFDTGYDTDEFASNIYSTFQHEPTMIESDTEHHNLHPVTNMTPSSDVSTRKRHRNLSIRRLGLSTRRKGESSFGIHDDGSSDKKTITDDNHQRGQKIYSRRHSFDNLREYGLPSQGTNAQRHMTTTSGKTRKQHGKSPLGNHDTLATTTTITNISQISSTSSTSSIKSSFLAPTPLYISSSNIPTSATNRNDSPRNNSSPTLCLGTPQTDPEDVELDNSGIDSSQQQTIIEITQQDNDNQPPQKTLYFDYDSLPWDNIDGEPQGIKALVKRMVDNGFGKMTETYINPDNDEDGNDHLDSKINQHMGSSGEDTDSDGDNGDTTGSKNSHTGTHTTIESSKVIGGDAYYAWLKKRRLSNVNTGTRRIAEIHVTADNDTGFFKLTQLAEKPMIFKGRLLNLYVSFLVPGKTDDDMMSTYQETSILDQNMDNCLLSLNPFIDDAKVFLNERTQQSRVFAPMGTSQQEQQYDQFRGSRKNSDPSSETDGRDSNNSSCSLSSFSSITSILPSSTSTSQPEPRLPPSLSHSNRSSTFLPSLWNYVPCQQYNVYDCRQQQLRDAISDLKRGMDDFKRSLQDTENIVHDVQNDMNDTKVRMDTYLKDVPETHYSELKRLEVGIESILAHRAKSKGMELLYWLLTALLTGCAFLLWAVIRILKFGQTAISFPGKMIKTFNDERNKEVKQTDMRIMVKGVKCPSSFGQPHTHSDDSIFPPATDVPTGPKVRRSSSRQSSYSQFI